MLDTPGLPPLSFILPAERAGGVEMLLEGSSEQDTVTLNSWHAAQPLVAVRVSISVFLGGAQTGQALEGEDPLAVSGSAMPPPSSPTDTADLPGWTVSTWPHRKRSVGSLWLFHQRLNGKVSPRHETLLHFYKQRWGKCKYSISSLFLSFSLSPPSATFANRVSARLLHWEVLGGLYSGFSGARCQRATCF